MEPLITTYLYSIQGHDSLFKTKEEAEKYRDEMKPESSVIYYYFELSTEKGDPYIRDFSIIGQLLD